MDSSSIICSVQTLRAIRDSYKPMGAKIGTETEHLVTFTDNTPLSEKQANDLAKKLDRENIKYSREIFAGVFETKTVPYGLSNLAGLFNQNACDYKKLKFFLASQDMALHELPFDSSMSLDKAMQNKISHPRADGLLNNLMGLNKDIVVEHCVMTTGVHVSVGYETLDDALEIASLASRLTPLLTLLMENGDGYSNGQAFKGHAMAHRRHGQGARTDIQRYFYEANNGEEMLDMHIEHICNVPTMMYLDEGNKVQISSDPDTNSLAKISKKTDINAGNFYLVEKMQYNDVKLASILSDTDEVKGHRVEIRMADRGYHQHDSMVLIALMIADKNGRQILERFLADHGYGRNEPDILDKVRADLSRSIYHGGLHLSQINEEGVSFARQAKEFGDALNSFLSNNYPQFLPYASNLLGICNTGKNEAELRKKNMIRGKKYGS